MKKGRTSLNNSEALWWQKMRRTAEREAWEKLKVIFPRLQQFDAPAGRINEFRFQHEQQKVEVIKDEVA